MRPDPDGRPPSRNPSEEPDRQRVEEEHQAPTSAGWAASRPNRMAARPPAVRAAIAASMAPASTARAKKKPWPSSQPSPRSRSAWAGLLDALGDDPQAERVAEGDDRVGERPLVRVAVRRDDELPGDLQDVDREAAQVAQRRVAGAEVVDGDPDAERARATRAWRSSSRCPGTSRSRSSRGPAAPGRGRSPRGSTRSRR